MKAQYERDMAIKQAGFQAETQQAKARAAQAGPLAEAQASQQVIQKQTALAQRQAELAAQRLEAEVRRPADAEAYKTSGRSPRPAATRPASPPRPRRSAGARSPRPTVTRPSSPPRPRRSGRRRSPSPRPGDPGPGGRTGARRADARRRGQADANQALAASLREGNQEVIAANALIENLPGARRGGRARPRRR